MHNCMDKFPNSLYTEFVHKIGCTVTCILNKATLDSCIPRMHSMRYATAPNRSVFNSSRLVNTMEGVKGCSVERVNVASIRNKATPCMVCLMERSPPRINPANKIKRLSFLQKGLYTKNNSTQQTESF